MVESVLYENLPDYLTIKELRSYLRIGQTKAYQLARRSDFPSVRFGNKKVFPKSKVREWADKQAEIGMRPKKLRAI